MLDIKEAKSAVKALYLQAASLSGFEVRPFSPERFAELVQKGFKNIHKTRRPEAVANILKVIAATLETAQQKGVTILGEEDVDAGKDKICPVYPFNKTSPKKSRLKK
jgi:hypothetical protein